MRTQFLCLLALVTLLGGCKKSVSGGGSNAANSWTFGGKSFKAASVVYASSGGVGQLTATAAGATASSGDGLIFTFYIAPTSNVQLLITDTQTPGTAVVATAHLSGSAITGYLNKQTTVKANITVAGGKVSASFPGTIWLYNSTNANDSLPLTVGTISQN